MVVDSKFLRGIVAFALSAAMGLVAIFVLGILLPLAYVLVRHPTEGDAFFLLGALGLMTVVGPSLALVSFLTAVIYRRLSPPPRAIADGSREN